MEKFLMDMGKDWNDGIFSYFYMEKYGIFTYSSRNKCAMCTPSRITPFSHAHLSPDNHVISITILREVTCMEGKEVGDWGTLAL